MEKKQRIDTIGRWRLEGQGGDAGGAEGGVLTAGLGGISAGMTYTCLSACVCIPLLLSNRRCRIWREHLCL